MSSIQQFAGIATSLLVVLAFSILTTAYVPYQTSPPPPPPPPPAVCADYAQLCRTYGPYGCCSGLTCVASEAGGRGVCLPQTIFGEVTRHEGETPKCVVQAQACNEYGDYQCCDGLDCIVEPVSRLGFCLPKPEILNAVPTLANIFSQVTAGSQRTCKNLAQLCLPYGPGICCPGEGTKCLKLLVFGVGNIGVCALDLPLPIYNGIP